MKPKLFMTMQPVFAALIVLATLPVSAADPQTFSPAPLRLELPRSPAPGEAHELDPFARLRLHLSIRAVIDYSIPVQSSEFRAGAPRGYNLIDAPGAGYREQRARARSK
jgi:hypothetical protein